MFNIPLQGHEERYECAEEWLGIVKRLWTQEETFDHAGKFYKIRKGYLAPKPLQQPYPAIMNAGGSPAACSMSRSLLITGSPVGP